MATDIGNSIVSKIAIFNSYKNKPHIAEVEVIIRFIKAAKNLGIEVIHAYHYDEIYEFNPDFIIPVSYQEPKLTKYPTYGNMLMPLQYVKKSPRFLRNTLSYDGYIVGTPLFYEWLEAICMEINKNFHVANGAFSVPKTEYQILDFSNAKAVYLGTNWDGLRHHKLFHYFTKGDYLKCFGPKESWQIYPSTLYGGTVPFDGISALRTYQAHGIGLCINHPDFDQDGTPSSRTFEIPASGAVAICTNNTYTKHYYGDTVLYVDQNLSSFDLSEAIKEKIDWVRNHPKQAQEIAKHAHEIFNQKLSMEVFIKNIINMHFRYIQNNGFVEYKATNSSVIQPLVVYLVYVEISDNIQALIDNINQQTYRNVELIVLCQNHNEKIFKKYINSKISLFYYDGKKDNLNLLQFLLNKKCSWFGILKDKDRIFPNHTSLLIQYYKNSIHDREKESMVITFSNSLEHADKNILEDKIKDSCMLRITDSVRVGNLTNCAKIPLTAILFKLTPTLQTIFKEIDFSSLIKFKYTISQDPLDVAIHANGVTCSSFVNENLMRMLEIENSYSPLNFLNA